MAWEELETYLVLNYHRLSPSGRAAMVQRFAALGQRGDKAAAKAGFQGLASLASFDTSIRAFLSPAALAGLASAYAGATANGQVGDSVALGSLLGVSTKERE